MQYNSVNGEHACESSSLQNDFLKGELGFAGYVVSDWGGTWSTDKSAAYGLDSCMPGTGLGGQLGAFFGEELVDAATIGTVSEARLDDMAIRILTPYYHLGQDKDDFPATNFDASSLAKQGPYATNENVNVQADHWKLVKQIGEESATYVAPWPSWLLASSADLSRHPQPAQERPELVARPAHQVLGRRHDAHRRLRRRRCATWCVFLRKRCRYPPELTKFPTLPSFLQSTVSPDAVLQTAATITPEGPPSSSEDPPQPLLVC